MNDLDMNIVSLNIQEKIQEIEQKINDFANSNLEDYNDSVIFSFIFILSNFYFYINIFIVMIISYLKIQSSKKKISNCSRIGLKNLRNNFLIRKCSHSPNYIRRHYMVSIHTISTSIVTTKAPLLRLLKILLDIHLVGILN